MIPLKRYLLPRTDVNGFGTAIEQWSSQNKHTFLKGVVSMASLLEQCKAKSTNYSSAHRKILSSYLSHQYSKSSTTEAQESNLRHLAKDNTLTITTGHQLSLGLGPLFLIYKALHVINLCEQLNKEQTEYHLVPVFWLASEDHDFEEIKSTQFFHKDFAWESNQTGPVGRFETSGLNETYQAMLSLFQQEAQDELMALFQVSEGRYVDHYKTLLNKVFGSYGLLIMDGDNPELKRMFIPLMQKELESQFVFEHVNRTNQELLDAGLKTQAYVRPINLFYMTEGKRSRIIPSSDGFLIDEIAWNKDVLFEELKEFPERFSPNVLFRPIYQECILPNICYVGGSGEMAYWAQLKSTFSAANVEFPLIQTRISALITPDYIDESVLPSYFSDLSTQIETLLSKQSNRDAVFNEIDKEVINLKHLMNYLLW
jgi:bacillithiol biosynthesis cysteine-adding enzyme BshC